MSLGSLLSEAQERGPAAKNVEYSPLDPGDRQVRRRAVIQFILKISGTADRNYWLIVRPDGDTDLCMIDPRFGVDLYVSADLKALTLAWMGHSSFAEEIADEQSSRPATKAYPAPFRPRHNVRHNQQRCHGRWNAGTQRLMGHGVFPLGRFRDVASKTGQAAPHPISPLMWAYSDGSFWGIAKGASTAAKGGAKRKGRGRERPVWYRTHYARS